ncbi:MAG TPA: hypothetical protein VJP04_05460 [Terriglobales bacterium]|nr:hypothetical protein [Terriglobales bacterium]
MQAGEAGNALPLKGAKVSPIRPQQQGQYFAPFIIQCGNGGMLVAHRKQSRRLRRGTIDFVGENFLPGRMIHRQQLYLVEVIHLAHLVGKAKQVTPVPRLQGMWQAHKLLRIGLGQRTVGLQFAQRSRTQHIGYEGEFMPIPGVDKRTGTGEALRLAKAHRLVRSHVQRVLHNSVGPGHAYDIHPRQGVRKNPYRRMRHRQLVIEVTRLHFHHYPNALLITLMARQRNLHPMWRRSLPAPQL